MTFEFLIACHPVPETNIKQILTDLLTEALDSNSNEFDDVVIADMIQFRHEYFGNEFIDNEGVTTRYVLIGFALELNGIDFTRDVVDYFASSLPDTSPIYHVVKFEDPLLKEYLAERADEIFDIEMKLRRALSIIYLNAYQGEEPFRLLRDEEVKPMKQPKQAQMKEATQNQFFHLTFSEYRNLNQYPQLKLPYILEVIRNAEQYDIFRAEIRRRPIEDEGDVGLIADLEKLINPIEDMRNCVAHNRRPTQEITDSYPNARQILNERLDQYLANRSVSV